MKLIDDRGLALRFNKGLVTPKERLIYLLILNANSAALIVLYITGRAHAYTDYRTWIFGVLWMAIVLLGTSLCYLTNARGDGRDFIDRLICLSVPAGIQTFLAAASLALIYSTTAHLVGNVGLIYGAKIFIDFFLSSFVLFSIYFYYRLNHCIRIAAARE